MLESFTYHGSIVNKQGGTDANINIRIGKARAAFLQLKSIWTSRKLSMNTKIRLFNTNVKPVLM